MFIAEFLVDGNGARAAVAAGYAKANAKQIACQVLKNPAIAAEIERRTSARVQRLEIEADNVLQEIARLGFTNMLDNISVQPDGTAYVDLSRVTRDQAAAIVDIQVVEYTQGRGEEKRNVRRFRVKLCDKGANLERLGRHFKLFTDKLEVKSEYEQRLEELAKLPVDELKTRSKSKSRR